MENISETEKVCFVIMPISDVDGYEPGHFKRVYEYIIIPACKAAGFKAIRADDVKKTNVIVIDILQKLLSSEMAICDLSAQNPNVLYELGIRQAFDLPVCFIKDNITNRIFDIQGFRDMEYDSSLRIDEVNNAIERLTIAITTTYNAKGEDVNSVIELLGISKAKINKSVEVSPETDIVLKALKDISSRLGNLEEHNIIINNKIKNNPSSFNQDGVTFSLEDMIRHPRFGLGRIVEIQNKGEDTVVKVNFNDIGLKQLLAKFVKFEKS